MLLTSDVGWRKRQDNEEAPLPKAAATRYIPADSLPDSIPTSVKQALTRCSIPDALMYAYDEDRGTHHYIIVEIKYCRDTDPSQQQSRAEEQHQLLKQTIEQYEPQATVEQVTLLLGVSGVIYKSLRQVLQEKLGVARPQVDALLTDLHHIAVESLDKIWRQRWAMINRPDSKAEKQPTYNANPSKALQHTRKRAHPCRKVAKHYKALDPPKRGQG
jgi:hypothetical protein